MKKLCGILLTFCVMISCFPAVAAVSPYSYTAQEKQEIETFLNWFRWSGNDYTGADPARGTDNYHPSGLLGSLVEHPLAVDYSIYPVVQPDMSWTMRKDPKGRWTSYSKFQESSVNWILTYVFGLQQTDIDVMKARIDAGEEPYIYRYNGAYYSFLGGVGGGYEARITRMTKDDYYYRVTYQLRGGDGYWEDMGTRYALFTKSSYNGKEYWTLRYDGRTEPMSDLPFLDVPANVYYAQDVCWALDNAVTSGTSDVTFSPDAAVTRGQAVTFLWRAMGEPAPKSTICPFTDVKSHDYYYQAVLWAMEQGVTNGTGPNTFSPNATLTRGHIITFLWRTAGRPGETGGGMWYADAVNWARRNDLLEGTAAAFTPDGSCPRSDVVTYLSRAHGEGVLEPSAPAYDFVLDNCSWTEAFQKAKAAGGHLVRIETREEYDRILSEIDRRGLDFAEFRVGARREESKTDYYWMDGSNKRTGRALNDTLHRIGAQWEAGEPSFQWNDTPETVLEFYLSGEDWVWNDMTDQPEAAPFDYYGYIIEY